VRTAEKSFKEDIKVKIYKNNRGAYDCRINSTRLVEGFKWIKELYGLKILLNKGSTQQIKDFFTGLINGDGLVSNRKGGGIISIAVSNLEKAKIFQLLLRKIGVISKIKKTIPKTHKIDGRIIKAKKPLYYIDITRKVNITKLYSRKLVSYKRKNLTEIIKRKGYSHSVPDCKQLLKDNKYYKSSSITYDTLKKIKPKGLLKRILDAKPYFDQLVKSEFLEDQEVYNLQTEKNKTFIANFLPVHNCAIDELDKMHKQDIAMMNNAMNDLRVSIDKANIHGVLETDTMVLAAANPKDRVFDKRELLWKQIGLPKDHLDRYDLIFPVENMESEKDQRKVAGVIFSKYKKSKRTEPIYDKDFVRKYIAYARQNVHPVMTDLAEDYITDNFINLVKPRTSEEDQAYFSSRLLTNIIRLATAAAKTRLSQKVEEGDALIAINILIDSLKKQDIIKIESGKLSVDIERMEAIIPKPKRDKKNMILRVIKDFEDKSEKKTADIEDVLRDLKAKGFTEDEFDDFVERMKKEGEVYEPVRGKIKTIR
jgi:hypothetical protein